MKHIILIFILSFLCQPSFAQSTVVGDEAFFDNIKIDGNTISSEDTDGDINLTPNGSGDVIVSPLSQGSILFGGPNSELAENNTLLYWDDTNHRLSLGAKENTLIVNGSTLGVQQSLHSNGDFIQLGLHAHKSVANQGAIQYGARSRGSEGSESAVQDDDTLYRVVGVGHDGTDYLQGAEIDFEVDGTPGTDDMPGRLLFRTTPDGGVSPQERMRISSDGNVGINGDAADTAILDVSSTAKGSRPFPSMTEAQRDAISTPPTGLMVYNTDTNAINQYDGSAWTEVSGSGGGGENFFSQANAELEDGTGDWEAYDDSGAFDDGTGGTPGAISISHNTSPSTDNNLQIDKAASDASGEGVSVLSETINDEDEGSWHGNIWVDASAANYVADDARLWCYLIDQDTSANNEKHPASNDDDGYIPNAEGRVDFTCNNIEDHHDQLRVALHIETDNASASSYSIFVDALKVNTGGHIYSSINTEPQNYDPTETNFSVGNGVQDVRYTRFGKHIFIQGSYVLGSTSSISGIIQISPPAGLTLQNTQSSLATGWAHARDNSSPSNSVEGSAYIGSNVIQFRSGNAVWDNDSPFTWADSDRISFGIWAEVEEWNSGNVMSTAEASQQTIRASAKKTTNTNINDSTDTTIIFDTIETDEFNIISTGNGAIQVPRRGDYLVMSHVFAADVNFQNGDVFRTEFQKNATRIARDTQESGDDGDHNHASSITKIVSLEPTDTLEVIAWQNTGSTVEIKGSTDDTYISIMRVADFNTFGVNGVYERVEAVLSDQTTTSTSYVSAPGSTITIPSGTWSLSMDLGARIDSGVDGNVELTARIYNVSDSSEVLSRAFRDADGTNGSVYRQSLYGEDEVVLSEPKEFRIEFKVNDSSNTAELEFNSKIKAIREQ